MWMILLTFSGKKPGQTYKDHRPEAGLEEEEETLGQEQPFIAPPPYDSIVSLTDRSVCIIRLTDKSVSRVNQFT